MSEDKPILSTPRRQRFLLGLPYGLSNATLLAGLSPTGCTETAPELPASPKESEHGPVIGQDVARAFESKRSRQPSPINHCPCGRRISTNKTHCRECLIWEILQGPK